MQLVASKYYVLPFTFPLLWWSVAGDFDNNIDPDNNLYNDIDLKCNYYTDNQFDTNMQDIGLLELSIIHFNARSLNANFLKIYDYLIGLSLNFDIIAISEIWIQSDSIAEFQINGYELFSVRRETKGGGGVVLYVKQDIQCQFSSVSRGVFWLPGNPPPRP